MTETTLQKINSLATVRDEARAKAIAPGPLPYRRMCAAIAVVADRELRQRLSRARRADMEEA